MEPALSAAPVERLVGRPVVTWHDLRRLGFRLDSHGVDNQPHMVCSVHPNQEVGLEIAPAITPRGTWTIWLRSDMAHSRCRFCFLRHVTFVDELVGLIEAIQGRPVIDVEYDRDVFEQSLAREMEEAKRRYAEYCADARWGRIPGGL